MRSPLNIGRAASFLMRRYGEDSRRVAFSRAQYSAVRDDMESAFEWRLVMATLNTYLQAEPSGPLH